MNFTFYRAFFNNISCKEGALRKSDDVEAFLKVGVCKHSIASHSCLLLEISEEGGLGAITNFDAVRVRACSLTKLSCEIMHARVNTLVTKSVEYGCRQGSSGLADSNNRCNSKSFHYLVINYKLKFE